MAGHSKWAQIKRKKAANDTAKAKEFTKITKLITFAVQKGGPDPENNPSLALAISKAKELNMPKENIEKAIKKASGELNKDNKYEEVSYEVFAPGNVSVIIDCMTDNKNRTITEVRSLVEKLGGVFTSPGTISWQFNTKGRILLEYDNGDTNKNTKNIWKEIDNKQKIKKENAEDIALELMEIDGIEDLNFDDFGLEIITEPSKLNDIRKYIESKNYIISETSLIKISKNKIKLNSDLQEKFYQFIHKIEEIDDVQNIWFNLEE